MKSELGDLLPHLVRPSALLSVWLIILAFCPTAQAEKDDKLLGASQPSANAVPGSPELPLEYIGPALPDPNAPDGHLMYNPGVQNIEISRSNRKPSAFFDGQPGWTYQHHIGLACWKGRFYAVWDMTPRDEDVPPEHLVYSTSSDGFHWSEPKDLYPPNTAWNLRFYFYHASNDRLLVFAAGPAKVERMKEDMKHTLLVREIGPDGHLEEIYTLINPGPNCPPPFEQSQDVGFVAACREAYNNRPLLQQQDYGNLLGDRRMKWNDAKSWPNGKMGGSFGKAFCFYHRKDGTLVGICKMGWVTLSKDGGDTWSLPVTAKGLVTGMAKVWAQQTPDGRYAMIYNPQREERYPLAITTSDDGITFRNMRVIHGEEPPQRYAGNDKNLGAQYVRGVAEWGGDAPSLDTNSIWVIYSMNKEDIWVSRIPVPIQAAVTEPVDDTFDQDPVGPRVPGWNTYSPLWSPVSIAGEGSNHYLEMDDREPVDYARAIRVFPISKAVDVSFKVAAQQADRGRLEIELLGGQDQRPVRIVLNEEGKIQAVDGRQAAMVSASAIRHENAPEFKPVDLGSYQAGAWKRVAIHADCASGTYSLAVDGKEVLTGAKFAEGASELYALSLRTGKFRGTVSKVGQDRPDKLGQDIPNTEEPPPMAVYRIDDVRTENPKLPRILLIGDSISHGYAPAVCELLSDKANVYRLPVNGGSTTNGLAHLAEWLGDRKWDVIHFNWGLHDIKVGPSGKCWVSPEDYETNLRRLVEQLKATGARLIWATTTPVPGRVKGITRRSADVIAYNALAKKVMDENGIAVDDLYSLALPQLATIQLPANVHYTPEGYRVLAKSVVASIGAVCRSDELFKTRK